MIKLIKKDINVMSRYLLLAITFPIWASIIASLDRPNAYFAFILQIMFLSYGTIDSSVRDDKKANSHMLFRSFPINRKDAIKSKYIVYGLVPFFYSLIFYISVIGVRENSNSIQSYFFTDVKLGFDLVVLAISITLIVFSIQIPLLNKGGNSRIFMWILIASIYLLGARYIGLLILDGIFNSITWIILLIISVVSYLVSFKVAINMGVEE